MASTAVLSSGAAYFVSSSIQGASSQNCRPRCLYPALGFCRQFSLYATTSAKYRSSARRRTGCIRAAGVEIEEIELKKGEGRGLAREGTMAGGRWLSSTTRHVRIYIGFIDPNTHEMDQQQSDLITIDLDPDSEFLWPEDKQQKVFDFFDEQVENYAGAPMDEYTLRLIGSEVEHFIRKMLVNGEIKYNMNCRVLNFSMGKPRLEDADVEDSTKAPAPAIETSATEKKSATQTPAPVKSTVEIVTEGQSAADKSIVAPATEPSPTEKSEEVK